MPRAQVLSGILGRGNCGHGRKHVAKNRLTSRTLTALDGSNATPRKRFESP